MRVGQGAKGVLAKVSGIELTVWFLGSKGKITCYPLRAVEKSEGLFQQYAR